MAHLKFPAHALLFFSLIAACDGDKGSGDDSNPGLVDADGDGYTTELDCDDGNASVHPAAEEICDSLDSDCDGTVDEGVQATFYEDADSDGYGVSSVKSQACEAPPGTSAVGGDCDDTDAAVAPDLADACDGSDNNCNGLIDEDDAVLWYRDADGDLYGDEDRVTESCLQPEGYVAAGGDCDDGSSKVSPDATEVCNDLVDNDCDGIGCRYEGSAKLAEYTKSVSGASSYDQLGYGVAALSGWYTGTRVVAAGAPGYDSSASAGGAVYVFDWSLDGSLSRDTLMTIYSKEASAGLGAAVVNGGVLDGDGKDELLISAPYANNSSGGALGEVYIINGGLSGTHVVSDDALTTFVGRNAGAAFGTSVASLDIDGDGVRVIAVGAPGDVDSSGTQTGAVYVFPSTLRGAQKWSSNKSVLSGRSSGDYFGMKVANGGDTDGDGAEELLVSSPYSGEGAASARGSVMFFSAPLSVAISATDADARVIGDADGLYVGYAVADGADYNNDGYDDAIFCAPGASDLASVAGAAMVFYGPLSESETSARADVVVGLEESSVYGCQSVEAADIDGDGSVDLILGSPSSNLGTSYGGAIFLSYGPQSGTVSAEDSGAVLYGSSYGSYVGYALDAADLDGDGYGEVVVGSPDLGTEGSPGRVYYLPGLGM